MNTLYQFICLLLIMLLHFSEKNDDNLKLMFKLLDTNFSNPKYFLSKFECKDENLINDIISKFIEKYSSLDNTTDIKDNGLIRDIIKQNNFNYLPGTFVEAERINKLLSENNYQTLKYSGVNGTEDSFYKLSGEEADIIHLATHGFYYSSDADIEWVSRIISQYPPQQLTKEDASLCRTGLILSNAKNGLAINKNIANNDDGILTAKEISQVNLHGLTLTVLSACKTAQGDVNGDGVFGLQRGFKKAGAQAILMSLWSVNDQATLFLMEHFYYHLLHGESFHKSLILAQSELRSSNDGIFNHPS